MCSDRKSELVKIYTPLPKITTTNNNGNNNNVNNVTSV